MTEHDPKLTTALGHHMFALEVAIERLSKATQKPIAAFPETRLTS